MGRSDTKMSIREGVRIVTNDIRDRHHLGPGNFEVSDNWPIMMSLPELNDIYEHSEERIKHIEESVRVEIDRPALNRITFDHLHERTRHEETSLKERILSKYQCSKECLQDKLLDTFPFVKALHKYKFRECLLKDLIAGFSVALVHIPQSMGFALLAGVQPIYGLYSSFFPTLIYFLLGQSRHISVGTMAIISILIRNVVDREAEVFLHNKGLTQNELETNITDTIGNNTNVEDTDLDNELQLHKASTASAFTLLACIIMLAMGVLRLGVIKKLMPTSFISGFTTGAAFHIGTSQIPSMLGVQLPRRPGVFKLPIIWVDICKNLPNTHIASLVLSIIVVFFLVLFREYINVKLKKKLPIPIPIEVIVLILTTGFSYAFHFHERWEMKIIGSIPKGFPPPVVPPLNRASTFVADAFITAVVSFTITISMADIFARKYKYNIDVNHELISNALSYGIGAIFHCFIGASAPPRCFIQESCGAKTKVASMFTFSVLLIVILFLGPLFESLPKPALGCIIFVALFPLFKQFKMIPALWRISKVDLSIWLVTWSTVTILDVWIGLGLGIIWSLLTIPILAMCDVGFLLGRTPFQDIYAPLSMYKMATTTGEFVIFRYENALFFATIEKFKQGLFKAAFNPNRPKPTIQKKMQSPIHANGNATNMGFTHSSSDINVRPISGLPDEQGQGKDVQDYQTKTGSEPISKSQDGAQNKEESNNVEMSPRPIHAIILDCSAMTYVDLMGLMTLKELSYEYSQVGTRFLLANCTQTLIKRLENDGQIGGQRGDKLFVFPTIQDAVLLVNMIKLSKRERTRRISIV